MFEEHRRFLAFLITYPGAELIILNAVDHIRDIGETNCYAILVGDDDWPVGMSAEKIWSFDPIVNDWCALSKLPLGAFTLACPRMV